jgi:RNA binding exosome subunit
MQISLIVHATEDITKVIRAVRNLLPDTIEDNLNITQTQLQGYYKNPIIRIEISLQEPIEIKTILKHMLMNLSENDRAFLALQFKDHIDAKKNLFLRFNKQDAFLGKISLCTADPIHVKTKLSFLPTTLSDLEAVL